MNRFEELYSKIIAEAKYAVSNPEDYKVNLSVKPSEADSEVEVADTITIKVDDRNGDVPAFEFDERAEGKDADPTVKVQGDSLIVTGSKAAVLDFILMYFGPLTMWRAKAPDWDADEWEDIQCGKAKVLNVDPEYYAWESDIGIDFEYGDAKAVWKDWFYHREE